MNCCACSGVSVACPLIGFPGGLPRSASQTTTGPLLPGVAGPWKCAKVTALDNPLYGMFQVTTRVAGSKVSSTSPVPLVATGGTHCSPVNGNLKESACVGPTEVHITEPARTRTRREIVVFMIAAPAVPTTIKRRGLYCMLILCHFTIHPVERPLSLKERDGVNLTLWMQCTVACVRVYSLPGAS
jgi:hypothetical protein